MVCTDCPAVQHWDGRLHVVDPSSAVWMQFQFLALCMAFKFQAASCFLKECRGDPHNDKVTTIVRIGKPLAPIDPTCRYPAGHVRRLLAVEGFETDVIQGSHESEGALAAVEPAKNKARCVD